MKYIDLYFLKKNIKNVKIELKKVDLDVKRLLKDLSEDLLCDWRNKEVSTVLAPTKAAHTIQKKCKSRC